MKKTFLFLVLIFVFVSSLWAWEETCTWTGPNTQICCGVDNLGRPYCNNMLCTVSGGVEICVENNNP